jgi:hypothetical protein
MTNSKTDHIPDAAEKVELPTLEDILTDYQMNEISTATAIDYIQAHIDDSRASVLDEVLEAINADMWEMDHWEVYYKRIKQIIQKAKGAR